MRAAEHSEASADISFRAEVREWLADNLVGEFGALRGLGGPGREHEAFHERLAWNKHLAAAGWTCLGWPVEHGRGRRGGERPGLAGRAGRAGSRHGTAGDLPRGVRARRRTVEGEPPGGGAA